MLVLTVSNAKAANQYTAENKENDMLKVNEKKSIFFEAISRYSPFSNWAHFLLPVL